MSIYQELIPANKTLPNQFLIAKIAPVQPEYVDTISIKNWNVYLYPETKYIKILDDQGMLIGIIIGTLIDYNEGKIIETPLTVEITKNKRFEAVDVIEKFIYGFGGSYIFFLSYGGRQRVYLDANGSKSLVYDPEKEMAASSTGLLLDDREYKERFDAELYGFLDIECDGWFAAGLTAHHGVKRLLCNHYLDLKTGQTHRHWPKGNVGVAKSTRDHAVRIAEIVGGTANAMVRSGPTACSLTGGRDTRFLLASCKSIVHDLTFFTVDVDSPTTALDVNLSKRISTEFNLDYRVLDIIHATSEEQILWQYRSSHCMGGENRFDHPTLQQVSKFKYTIGGLGGEIGRGSYWRATDTNAMKLSAKDIAPRLGGMPSHERVTKAVAEWLRTVEDFNSFTKLDLAYMELCMSAWAFPQSYSTMERNQIHPMICREAFQLMLELSPEAKRSNAFISEGIDALWPELNNIPINKYGDHRDMFNFIRKISNPTFLLKKIRKKMG